MKALKAELIYFYLYNLTCAYLYVYTIVSVKSLIQYLITLYKLCLPGVYATICDVLIAVLKSGGINAYSFSMARTVLQLRLVCQLLLPTFAL